MATTTRGNQPSDVQARYPECVLTDPQIDVQLSDAALVIDQAVADYPDYAALTTATQKAHEAQLATHYCETIDPQAFKEQYGDMEVTFINAYKVGLNNSRNGQKLITMDSTGAILAITSGAGSISGVRLQLL